MAAADAKDLLILLNPFVYPHVLGTVFHPERYLAWDWWEGVLGGWCPASRNRVRLCWLFTPLAWARNRGLHSGLGETALTPEASRLPWWPGPQTTGQTTVGRRGRRPCSGGGLLWRMHFSKRLLKTTLVWRGPAFIKPLPPYLLQCSKNKWKNVFSFVFILLLFGNKKS